jgi:hypothetical protein
MAEFGTIMTRALLVISIIVTSLTCFALAEEISSMDNQELQEHEPRKTKRAYQHSQVGKDEVDDRLFRDSISVMMKKGPEDGGGPDDAIEMYGQHIELLRSQLGDLKWQKNCEKVKEMQQTFKKLIANLPAPTAPKALPPTFPPASPIAVPAVRLLLLHGHI